MIVFSTGPRLRKRQEGALTDMGFCVENHDLNITISIDLSLSIQLNLM